MKDPLVKAFETKLTRKFNKLVEELEPGLMDLFIRSDEGPADFVDSAQLKAALRKILDLGRSNCGCDVYPR